MSFAGKTADRSPIDYTTMVGGGLRLKDELMLEDADVAESLGPNVSIGGIARKHGIGTGQLYGWRHQFLANRRDKAAGFAQVELLSEPLRLAGPIVSPPGMIEIALPGGPTIRVDAQVDAQALRRVLAALRG